MAVFFLFLFLFFLISFQDTREKQTWGRNTPKYNGGEGGVVNYNEIYK